MSARASRVALVSGAGRGIGAAVAAGLSGAGLRVGLLGRDPAGLAAVADSCPGPTCAVRADVRDPRAVVAAVEQVVDALGPVDLLVNNAGRADRAEGPFWTSDPDDWWQVVETNLRGTANLCRAVLPDMVGRDHGRLVTLNSNVAVEPCVPYPAYSVSKAALLVLGDLLTSSLEGTGVRVFDISPGMVRTAMTDAMPLVRRTGRWTPVDRIAEVSVRVAAGELDPLAGRYLHVGTDDVDELLGRAAELRRSRARTLRLRPHGPDDPLAGIRHG